MEETPTGEDVGRRTSCRSRRQYAARPTDMGFAAVDQLTRGFPRLRRFISFGLALHLSRATSAAAWRPIPQATSRIRIPATRSSSRIAIRASLRTPRSSASCTSMSQRRPARPRRGSPLLRPAYRDVQPRVERLGAGTLGPRARSPKVASRRLHKRNTVYVQIREYTLCIAGRGHCDSTRPLTD
jgi:hypothetical protein